MPTRDQIFLGSFGTPPATIAVDPANAHLGRVSTPYPNMAASAASNNIPGIYMSFTPEMWKDRVAVPTNQGQRGGIAARQSMMYDPRNSPARSQMVQSYTSPIQTFASSNTWQVASGQSSKGTRQRQPSTKLVSPFESLPIPTRMPWDV